MRAISARHAYFRKMSTFLSESSRGCWAETGDLGETDTEENLLSVLYGLSLSAELAETCAA